MNIEITNWWVSAVIGLFVIVYSTASVFFLRKEIKLLFEMIKTQDKHNDFAIKEFLSMNKNLFEIIKDLQERIEKLEHFVKKDV